MRTSAQPYGWISATPTALPTTLAPVHVPSRHGVGGLLEEGVTRVLRSVGLLDVLKQVTGDGSALHAAGSLWLEQAHAVQEIAGRLRHEAGPLPEAWQGEASAAFGGFMERVVNSLDELATNLAETGRLLNRAGIEAALAEELVTGIIADAAEWAAAELAATLIADVLTFGIATVAGAVAESATMAIFVERATKVAGELGRMLEELAQELRSLKDAREAIRAADGLGKLRELRRAQETLRGLRLTGSTYWALDVAAVRIGAQVSGLPMTNVGPRGLARIIGEDVAVTIARDGEKLRGAR